MRRIDASFKTNKVSTLLTCNSITTVLWVLLSSEASTRYARRRYYVWASSCHVVGCWFQSMEQISNQTIFYINALLEWKNILCLRQFHSNDQAIVSVNFARVLVKYSTVVSEIPFHLFISCCTSLLILLLPFHTVSLIYSFPLHIVIMQKVKICSKMKNIYFNNELSRCISKHDFNLHY